MSKYKFEDTNKPKGTCPKCNTEKSFRYYQNDLGVRMPLEYGICDKKNKCGYHNIPTGNGITKASTKSNPKIEYIYPSKEQKDTFEDYLNDSSSSFHKFCDSIGIPASHLKSQNVGTDEKGLTVFVFRNKKGDIINCKRTRYATNGKRDKNFYSFSMKGPNQNQKYSIDLFGLESIDIDKEKNVVIVESEKTKVIASYFYPEYVWLASAAANGVKTEKAKNLIGREVIWLCDADKAGRDNSSIRNLRSTVNDIEVSDLFPEREDGHDLADEIIANIERFKNEKTKLDILDGIIKNELFFIKPTVEFRDDYSIWVKTKNNYEVVAQEYLLFIKYKTIDNEDQITWIIEIKTKMKNSKFIEVSHDDFCSAKKIKNILAKERLSFKGTELHLTEMQDVLFKHKFPDAIKVTRYGYHQQSGCYFFSNEVLKPNNQLATPGNLGIINSGEFHLCIPTSNNKLKHRFKLTDSQINFNTWFRIYAQAHTLEKAFIPVCFYVMSLFRDIILKHKGSSPILFLKGGAGTGKSSIVRSLTALFGFKQEDINLKSKNTEAALVKLMDQASNTLLWMDEYHPDFQHEGLLQAAYDNAGYHKTPDNNRGNTDTDSIEIHSALTLTSNFLPRNPIFFSRCILISVEDTKKTQSQREGYNQISDLESRGLAGISVELLKYRALIEENYSNAFDKLNTSLLEKVKGCDYPERITSNIIQCMTCAFILQTHNKIAMCESESEDDVLDVYTSYAADCIKHQHQIQFSNSDVAEFFAILQNLYDAHQLIEGVHFKFLNEMLQINLPSVYNLYKLKYRQINHGTAPDRDSIVQEILKIEEKRNSKEVLKSIRFSKNIESEKSSSQPVSNSLSLIYENYRLRFNLNLNREYPENNFDS
ncbi:DUF6371 domain-containing protein [Lacihabitans lacunae]|uniref:DUF6371 domain-containing protein n=1 Tax=Lacihabitans lacunae TaxID=1028214 RepID=A0ABV7Z073_9BACT